MAHEFTQRRRIDFYETDMAGIVHFSNFFRFMESAEHAFFRSLGLSLHHNEGGEMSGWARVHASCDYQRPARYQDLVEVRLEVREKTSNSLSYAIGFRKVDEETDRAEDELARGTLKVVYVRKGPGDERIRSAPEMPADVSQAIDVAP